VYALTIVLYELLTGQVPFTANTPVGVVIKTLNDPLPSPQSICSDIGD
jgi:serine/threonine-protein kinase